MVEISFARICSSLAADPYHMPALAEADLDLLERQAPARPFLLLRKRKAVVEDVGSPLQITSAILTKQGRGGNVTDRRNGARTTAFLLCRFVF